MDLLQVQRLVEIIPPIPMKLKYTSHNALLNMGRIVLGEVDTTRDPDCDLNICAAPIQRVKPERIFVHPSYNNPPYANDISLIRLNRKVDLNGWVAPICLPHGKQLTKFYVGEIMEIAGWGTTDISKPKTSKMLMFVKVPILEANRCLQSFNVELNINASTQMCAGGEANQDSCGGDSGGPLMFVEAYKGPPRYYAMGLVSFGIKHCGKKDKPAIYTRVAGFVKWILDHMSP
ncbi:hypothetical protein MML48_2g00007396 [Holotrichia oblita]|uniref:Uncharacterized protein n=1 Tax=Holotrichia oblita TaxID=644536 RepID=A0ACB9TP00_HOLOL|nr:hypothetical protein MML48_2g00007396 [Holotrichia oblita]